MTVAVRLGDQIAKDMIAVRISQDFRMAVAVSPDCFARRPPPLTTYSRCCTHRPTCSARNKASSAQLDAGLR